MSSMRQLQSVWPQYHLTVIRIIDYYIRLMEYRNNLVKLLRIPEIQIPFASVPSGQSSIFKWLGARGSWKIGLGIAVSAIIIYPKPFLQIMKPFIKRFRKFYQHTRAELSEIIFTVQDEVSAVDLIQNGLIHTQKEHVIIINILSKIREDGRIIEVTRSCLESTANKQQQEELEQLYAENILHEIRLINLQTSLKSKGDVAALIKGRESVLRRVQLMLLKLAPQDLYKIPRFYDTREVHVLKANRNLSSYEHVIKVLK